MSGSRVHSGKRRTEQKRLRFWLASSLAAAAWACGGSTDTPRPEGGPDRPLPSYLDPPATALGGVSSSCSLPDHLEAVSVEDFELGAAGGWYLSNDVCSVCQDYVNQSDAIRNANQAMARAAELAELTASLEACRPDCLAATRSPYYFDNPPVAETIEGGRCESRYAMHVAGGPFVDWGGNMGFSFSPPLNVTSVDVTDPETGEMRQGQGFEGITFWGRLGGASGNNIRIEVGEPHTDQNYTGNAGGPYCNPNTTDDNSEEGCDKFGAVALLRGDWQRFFIPFAEMRQQGWGRRAEQFDLTQLLSFSMFYAQGTWDFWIDDLAFYRQKP
jgi:hypothetical protein